MKPAAKRTLLKASAFFLLFALLASVVFISSRVTAPDLVPVSAFGAGFLTASSVFWALFRKRNSRKVIEALDRASIGDFSFRFSDGKDVDAELAEAYNRMARRLGRRFKAMEDQFQALHKEINSLEGYRTACADLEKKVAQMSRDRAAPAYSGRREEHKRPAGQGQKGS